MQIKMSNQVDSSVYADAIAIRRAVFVQEQHIDETLEIDTVTPATWHYVLYDQKQAVATARVTPSDQWTGHVQRVATLKAARGQGYARQLLQRIAADGLSLWLATVGTRRSSHCTRVLYTIRVSATRAPVYGGGFATSDDDIDIVVSILA